MSTPGGRNGASAPRDRWGSRLGFTLVAVGSAVGLGNVWRFSYVLGEQGGAAFLVLYVGVLVAIGLPVMIAELAIGRRAQSDAVGAFHQLAPGRAWVLGGYVSVLAAVVILSYYAVIGGWVGRYLAGYVVGDLAQVPTGGHGAFFESFSGAVFPPVAWALAFMAVTAAIVASGVQRGIERANRVLMPLLGLLLFAMAAYGVTLPNGGLGVRFLFEPDWSALARGDAYLAAVGQAFFSLSLGMGALLTYGSYLPREARLVSAAARIVALDLLVAVVAGLVIFPAVFSFGIDPASGAALAFVVLPGVFAEMPGGIWMGGAFFLLLGAAAVTSAVSLLEVVVAYAMRRLGWRRRVATPALAASIFLLGLLPSLGYGPLATVRVFGGTILDGMDLLASQVALPVAGMIFALFVGWGWPKDAALAEAGFASSRLGRLWRFALRWPTPVALFLVLLRSLQIL